MIDQESIEQFVRAKVLLQEDLCAIGDIPGGSEIESQIMFIETRVNARVKQSISHGIEEMNSLRHILNEMAKINN